MKILIVEDDEDSLFLLERYLKKRGHVVISCGSAEEAMKAMEGEFFPMICLDMVLPGMSGIDFCTWIRAKIDGDQSYILFLTGNANPENLKKILKAGANDYLEKNGSYDTSLLDIRLSIGEEQVRQIAERKRLEHQLSKERDMISRAVEISPALIIFLDAHGYILSFNRACRELTGYTLKDVQGKVYWDLPLWQSEKEAFLTVFHASTSRIRPYLRESEWTTRDGKTCYVSWSFSDAFDDAGTLEFTIGAGIDVTERREAQERLAYMAEHDSLTDLYNRSKLATLLERVLEEARKGKPAALLYIDLDKFKMVNDIAGHAAGDRLLIKVANLLREVGREEDLIVRFGGDEFIVILEQVTLEQGLEIAERYRSRFDNFLFEDSGKTFNISTSIGLAAVDGTKNTEELLASVDASCYTAKSRGRNRVEMNASNVGDLSRVAADADWSIRIKEAIRNRELELWFQPILHIPSKTIHYHEALLRLRDDPITSPSVYLSAVERSGSIAFLDRHVIELAAKALIENPGTLLSVNISGQSANDNSFFNHVIEVFESHAVEFDRMIFEVTETALMFEPEKARVLFNNLKEKGFRFALDDFGAGFSSLGYLRHLPVEILKVDGDFIKDLANQRPNQALVRYINQTAHILQLQTVAEFVETEETFRLIEQFGFDYAQGFLIGKPSRTIQLNLKTPLPKSIPSSS